MRNTTAIHLCWNGAGSRSVGRRSEFMQGTSEQLVLPWEMYVYFQMEHSR